MGTTRLPRRASTHPSGTMSRLHKLLLLVAICVGGTAGAPHGRLGNSLEEGAKKLQSDVGELVGGTTTSITGVRLAHLVATRGRWAKSSKKKATRKTIRKTESIMIH